MNKLPKTILFPALLMSALTIFSFTLKSRFSVRNIYLAGLVVNAENLSPIEAADIYDTEHRRLGSTDDKGYFNINLPYTSDGAIHFKLTVEKKGFQSFHQSENWGNIFGSIQTAMYFGLKASHSKADSFSELNNQVTDLDYTHIFTAFDKVKAEKAFNDKLAQAKAGNENVLLQVDHDYYIVDKGGWIKIVSPEDLVMVNNQKAIPASQLNAVVKRSHVRSMTPVTSEEAKFAIQTR